VTNDLSNDQRLHKVCSTLQAQGYAPLLVGRVHSASPPLQPRSYSTHRLRLFFERGKLFYLEFNVRLFFWLLLQRTQIITANDLDTLLACYAAARLRGRRLVYDAHELLTDTPEVYQRPLTRKTWLTLESWLVPRLRRMSTVSLGLAREYERRYGIQPKLIRNYPRQNPARQPAGPVPIALYQGHIKAGRGIPLMLEAMQYTDQLRLWLIGAGLQYEAMQAYVAELGVAERVQFWGWVPFEDLPHYTQQAGLGLSLEDPQAANTRYSAPNKLYDYLQAGLPVLGADLEEFRAAIMPYEAGEILAARTPEVLARQMERILLTPELHQRYARGAVNAAQYLCWEAQEEQLLALYR
jgi:glycosyltransferase involved in cell wall biosynthesis